MQEPDPGKEHRQPFLRFEQECQFLSRIKHPNIVLYLGTYRDPETNAPVLLMELMEESLTHFLESSPGDIPYHIQVNLSYDVAQALAFLHANGIIHRDLSSNNVLLIGGSRAKVSDFGMLKITDLTATRQATMTTCPGTPAFMSPEALNEPPVYTEKLDCFSFGVLLIQIVSRKFPAPSDRFEIERIPNRRNPTQTIEARILIPEVERRQAHISLIEFAHPLLPIALDCVKDREVERPSSQELCQSLDALKRDYRFEESSSLNIYQLLHNKSELIKEKDKQLLTESERSQAIQSENEALQHEVEAKEHQLRRLNLELESSVEITATLQRTLTQKDREITDQLTQLELKEEVAATLQRTITQKEIEITELREMLVTKNSADLLANTVSPASHQSSSAPTIVYKQNILQNEGDQKVNECYLEQLPQNKIESQMRDLSAKDEARQSAEDAITAQGLVYEDKIEAKEHQLRRITQELESYKEITTILQEHVIQRDREISKLREVLTNINLEPPSRVVHKWDKESDKPRPPDLAWKILPNSCPQTSDNSCAVVGNKAFCSCDDGIWQYHSTQDQWCKILGPKARDSTLVNVGDVLTTVGGKLHGDNNFSNKVLSYIGGRWMEKYPPMPTRRWACTVVCCNKILIVVGGAKDDTMTRLCAEVEILDISVMRWSRAHDLPFPTARPTIAICGVHIYLHAGNALLRNSFSTFVQPTKMSTLWTVMAVLPVNSATLVTFEGQLLAVGGKYSKGCTSTDIHLYKPDEDSWQVISQMNLARSNCIATLLPNNQLLVVGGNKDILVCELASILP